jgi:NAD-dependent SIR2 family protein deacetylase
LDLNAAADLVAQADAILIAAGAGMGVDSGLPDFRGNEGFWKAYPALGRARIDFTEIASPAAFERDPRLAWGFYGHRLALYRRTVPHAGFEILKRWAAGALHGGAVYTSNVDGQFQAAGFEAVGPIHECHGSIHRLQCLAGCGQVEWSADALQPEIDEDACRWRGELPACPRCGGLARPAILMFGDWGWDSARYDAQRRRLEHWLSHVERPIVIELGAGTHVPSVRHFGQVVVSGYGGQLLRINPREPDVSPAFGIGLACGALQALRAIDALLASG